MKKSIVDVVLPKYLYNIGELAFNGCENLVSMKLRTGFYGQKSIGAKAFKECKSLEKINIPSNVEYIGANAFDGCESLQDVTFTGRSITDVRQMENYPFGISNEDCIHTVSKEQLNESSDNNEEDEQPIEYWAHMLDGCFNK